MPNRESGEPDLLAARVMQDAENAPWLRALIVHALENAERDAAPDPNGVAGYVLGYLIGKAGIWGDEADRMLRRMAPRTLRLVPRPRDAPSR